MKNNSVVRRIDKDLYSTLEEIARKNSTSIRQASKDAAKIIKDMNGKKAVREIKF